MNTVSPSAIARTRPLAQCYDCGKRAAFDYGAIWTTDNRQPDNEGRLRCRSCSILFGYDSLLFR